MANQYTKTLRETSPLLPTLSLTGWVAGIAEKIDIMLSYYMASQYSQTTYHYGHVKSMVYTVQEFYNDPSSLAGQLKADIESLLKGFVDYVYATVTYEERDETGVYDYHIDITIQHAGFVWSPKKAIRVRDSKFELLANINNEGKAVLLR